MSDIISKAQFFVEMISQGSLCLTIFATIALRLFAKDETKVDSFAYKLLTILHKLPTFGLNPKTKLLEQQLKELKNKDESAKQLHRND